MPMGSGGGGGGAPTQQTITQSNIPDWLRPQVETVLGGAMQQMFTTRPGEGGQLDITGVRPYIPYSANPADYVAGFSPLQQQAMARTAGLDVPGQIGAATQMSGMAGQGGLEAARQAAGYGGAGYQSGLLGQQVGLSGAEAAAQRAAGAEQAAYGLGAAGLESGLAGQALGSAAQQAAAQQAQQAQQAAYGYGGAGYEAGLAGQALGAQARQAAARQAAQAQQAAYGYGGMGAEQAARQAAQAQQAAYGYGGMGAEYGGAGARLGSQAAALAPQAQIYGGRAADIGLGALGAQQTGAGVGDIARQYAGRQAGAGAEYAAGATSPAATQAYMSPYMQNVVDVQQQAAQRQADIASQARKAQFAQAGAFGGARQGIADAQAAAELARQKQGIQAQGLQQAFQQAQQAQQFGAGLGLQGLAGAQQGLGNVLQGGQLGLSGINQAVAAQQAGLAGLGQAGQLYGVGMQGAGLGMQGAGVGLQGIGQALGAGQLGLQGTGMGLQGVGQAINAGQLGLQGAGMGLQGTAQGMQGAGMGMQGVGQAINAGQLGLQGAGIGLQGTGQGMQGAGVGLQGVGQALGAGQLGIQGTGLGLQGAGMGMQGAGVGLQGVQGGLGGYGLLGQQAGTMGQLGAQQLAAQQGIIGLQAQQGALAQQQEQNIINQAIQNYAMAQQYPLQQFGAYNALLRGYAIPGQTMTQYQAAPSMASQLAGLGMGAYGLSRMMGQKKGGVVKSMAEGGYAAINEKVRNNPTKYSEDQIKRSASNKVLDQQTAMMALDDIAQAKQAAAGINMLPSGLPTQGYAPGGIVAFDDGGEVKRYQVGGLNNTGLANKARQELMEMEAGRRTSLSPDVQVFMTGTSYEALFPKTTDPQAAYLANQQEQMRRGAQNIAQQYKPASQLLDANLEMAPELLGQKGSALIPQPPQTPSAPAGAEAQGTALPAAPAAQPLMTMADILAQAKTAREGAVPAGLSNLKLEELTPKGIAALYEQAMPQGEAAYKTPLTPMYEEMAEESRKAARSRLEESQKISNRLDALRASQESRVKAKEKDLLTDRDRSVGIAFLEAAQAMVQPGQTFFQGLARSGAAGGKRFMEDKERLDKRADALTDALTRLDEARLGDARERAAAQADYNKALLDVRKSMIDQAQSAYNVSSQRAAGMVDTMLTRQAQVANFGLNQQKAVLDAQQGAERNALTAAQVAVQGYAAAKPTAQVELFTALGKGNLEKGVQLFAAAQQGKVSSEKLWTDLVSSWKRIDREPPSYQEFLAMLGRTVGGDQTGRVRPRND